MSQTKAQLIDTLVASLLPASDSSVDIGSNGVRFANIYGDTLYGDGSNLTGITSTTINSNADNRLITGSGSANTLNGESALTFDGQTLTISAPTNDTPFIVNTGSSNGSHLRFQKDGANKHFIGCGGGISLGDIDDLSLRTVDNIIFGVGTSEKMRIDSSGRVGISQTPVSEKLEVSGAIRSTSASANFAAGAEAVFMDFIPGNRGRIGTITGTGSARDLAFNIGNLEKMRIDTSGNVLVGLSSTLSSNNAKLQVAHTNGNADIIVHRAGNNANPPSLNFQKTRNASIGNYGTIVQNNDELGSIRWGGADGSNIGFAARIVGAVDGTPGANDMPGRIQFHTSSDGSESLTERMRIDSSGRVLIGTTNNTPAASNQAGIVFGDNTAGVATVGIASFCADGAAPLLLTRRVSDGNVLGIADDTTTRGLLRINSTDFEIRSNNNMRFQTGGGNERMRIDSVGAMLVGHSTSRNNFTSAVSSEHAPIIQLEGTNQKRILSITAVANSDGGSLILARQNGNVGQNTAVSSGQQVGKIDFQGSGGTNMEPVARISADVDGTPGDNDMPGRLCFKTTADGANSPSENMRIHSTGQVSISHPNYIADSHDYKLVVKPNITDSSKGGLGILVDGDSGTSGGASVDSISLKVKNTNTWNNATHQYGGYFEVNQQLLQPQTGIYSQATGLYNVQKCFSAQLNKNINAVTTGISYYSNIVQTGSGGAAYHAQFFDNGTEKLQIRLGGNILNANNTYGSLSDVKLKENIVDANSQWDDIKGLKIRNFNFKNDPDKVKMLGVIAQEAETVSAGLIETNDDIEINDETGEGTKTGTTKYVKYSILYMKSVKALQEAMTRIETLETKVAALEAA